MRLASTTDRSATFVALIRSRLSTRAPERAQRPHLGPARCDRAGSKLPRCSRRDQRVGGDRPTELLRYRPVRLLAEQPVGPRSRTKLRELLAGSRRGLGQPHIRGTAFPLRRRSGSSAGRTGRRFRVRQRARCPTLSRARGRHDTPSPRHRPHPPNGRRRRGPARAPRRGRLLPPVR
jgi:hypothetical protein